MSKLLKRGFSIYKIFLKNKIAMSVMMLVSGVMMFVAALQGKGNDTVAMPLGITIGGALLTLWSAYKVGMAKTELNRASTEDEQTVKKAALFMQSGETVIYVIVLALGITLLINQNIMNRILNLMAGGFTTLNGVLGVVALFKMYKKEQNVRFWFKFVLTAVELILGIYFLVNCDMTGGGWYIAMGALTTVAGTLEVISALTPESIRGTVQDGKDIVRILKDKDSNE